MRSAMCPNCRANVTIKEDNRDFCFCEYCGAKILLDDYRSTHRVIDEAKIKEVESVHNIRMRELDLEEKTKRNYNELSKVLTIIWIIITVVLIVVISGIWLLTEDFANAFLALFYLAGPIVGGGAYLIFKVLPEKELEKNISKNGGIKIPKSLHPFKEQNVETMQMVLKNMGFTDVSCVNLHDVKIGLLQKAGAVESVTIDGQTIKSSGKLYLPQAKIVITYHGK